MKTSITKGFLEKANFPLDQVKFAFTLKHIDRYKKYYSVTNPQINPNPFLSVEPLQEPLHPRSSPLSQRCESLPLG